MPYDDIIRNGFRCSFGRFYARHCVERVDSSSLKSMFLPRLTGGCPSEDFVRGQLQHYGVDYDEKDFTGNGTRLMKKVLQAGKCDKVPNHIAQLRLQMHMEWLEQLSEEELSGHPEWIMEKYIVDGSGKPDPAKTTKVVGIPYPLDSEYRAGQLSQAARRVSSTQTIYLGWDRNAVEKAAKDHAAKEERAERAKAAAREEERASKHRKYLANAKMLTPDYRAPSPIGHYIVDCDEIERNWPDLSQDMTLAIHGTPNHGIYQASFDFGVSKGVNDTRLRRTHDDEFDDEEDDDEFDDEEDDDEDEDEEDDDEDEDEDEDEDRKIPLWKTKATNKLPRGRPLKKARVTGAGRSAKYFVRLKSREYRTGMIYPRPQKGTIRFSGPDLSSFTGEVDISGIDRGIFFKARKISAVPQRPRNSWDNYSEAAYERARVDRWR
ncbi:hypothetical protein N656DRAFT_758203 [Canariomyces notabilis]|uniref:Uncharacterized protein n=1 Tax=Canariomyces notabilis TaxID=2074819 RepID=A0AAN6QHA4_9PEZI|nr:hypothetical protein N656DRAFT_758203 [Canariomyces arenarius]